MGTLENILPKNVDDPHAKNDRKISYINKLASIGALASVLGGLTLGLLHDPYGVYIAIGGAIGFSQGSLILDTHYKYGLKLSYTTAELSNSNRQKS